MDVVQLSEDYTAPKRRQFTFYHSVSRSSWYSFNRSRKDERMSLPWSHLAVLNTGLLDWESSALITTIIGKTYDKCKYPVFLHIKQILYYKVSIE